MWVCSAFMYIGTPHVFSVLGGQKGFQVPSDYWDLNSGPLKEQPMILTVAPKENVSAAGKVQIIAFTVLELAMQTWLALNLLSSICPYHSSLGLRAHTVLAQRYSYSFKSMCVCRYKQLVTFYAEYPFIFFKDTVKIYNLNIFYSYDTMLHAGGRQSFGGFVYLWFWGQSFTMQLRLTLNSGSSCLTLPSATTSGLLGRYTC